MRTILKLAGVAFFIMVSLPVLLAGPATAQEDLNCGDPGVGVNIPLDPNNDPNDFDRDGDGIGCEISGADGATAVATPQALPSHGTELPHTGSATTVLASIGALLLALGAVAQRAAQRLRPRHLAR
jgi:LPXTG-motif cell wall-anchored protein